MLQCGGCKDEKGEMRHDPFFARWTGLWPGSAEAEALGLFSKWSPETGWVKTDASDPEGHADLNTFLTKGYDRIFFIKPREDKGTDRYLAAVKRKEEQNEKKE